MAYSVFEHQRRCRVHGTPYVFKHGMFVCLRCYHRHG